MLSQHPNRPWLSLLGGALAAALAVVLLIEMLSEPHAPSPPAAPSPNNAAGTAAVVVAQSQPAPPTATPPGPAQAAAPAQPAAQGGAPLAAAASAPPPSQAVPTPPGVSVQQWALVQAELSGHPQRDAELQRISGYLGFQHQLQQFRDLRSSGAPTPQLQERARQLDSALAGHLARNELSAGEARLVKLALLEVLQPDATLRPALLASWVGQQLTEATPAQDDPREASFRAQQAALLAAWQARPVHQQDPRELEAQIDALRRRAFPEPR